MLSPTRLARHIWIGSKIYADYFRHRDDESIRTWWPVLRGVRDGYIQVPSHAVYSSRHQAQTFAAKGMVQPGDRVLDVGAGNGRQAIGLLELGVASYVGLEVVKECVEQATQAFKAVDADVRFDWLDVINQMYNPHGSQKPDEVVFPYDDKSFDVVVASSLYTHLERIEVAERYVKETARVLRPDGTAVMSFFRSPPNPLSSDALRTVFLETDITNLITPLFKVEHSDSGESTGFHDQWNLYLRKQTVA